MCKIWCSCVCPDTTDRPSLFQIMSSDDGTYLNVDVKIFQKKVYNFLGRRTARVTVVVRTVSFLVFAERPSRGWICFAYHFLV